MKNITAYALIGRKSISDKKKKPEEILYTGETILMGDTCSCIWVENVYNIFKTKKEAERCKGMQPFQYMTADLKVVKVKISVVK